MTRSEQEMYRNIERIAVALETIVIQGKDQKLAQFKKATNIMYGNDSKGRSSDNYNYPSKGTTMTSERTSMGNFQPVIESDLDERIYQESQVITGGFFQTWYLALTPEEIASYGRVYGH